MNRKGPYLIVAMSLSFVLIITLTFMLSNLSGNSSTPDNKDQNLAAQLPSGDDANDADEKDILVQNQGDNTQQTNGNTNNSTESYKEIPQSLESKGNNSAPAEEKNEEIPSNNTPADVDSNAQAAPQKIDKYLNRQTSNTNILCLGIADNKLEMISIYSINKDNQKSAGIFLPTRTTLKVNGEMLSLQNIYQKHGIQNLKKIVSQCLEVEIPYHMVADKQGLVELSGLIGPLYVENENIDIPNLFVRPVSDKDDKILQSLADRITEPKMLLQVPKLIKIFIANVKSDIGVSGLWELYQVFSKLNHSQLAKIVLWGEKAVMAGEEYWFISPYDWHNVVYEMTK